MATGADWASGFLPKRLSRLGPANARVRAGRTSCRNSLESERRACAAMVDTGVRQLGEGSALPRAARRRPRSPSTARLHLPADLLVAGGLRVRGAASVRRQRLTDWESDQTAQTAPAVTVGDQAGPRAAASPRPCPLPRRPPSCDQSAIETWIPLYRWCKAHGLAAPCPLAAWAYAGLRAEHAQRGLRPARRAASRPIGTGWKSGWGSRRR